MRVEPIRDTGTIKKITEALRSDATERGNRRYLLWLSGIYLGRRVSDLLELRVRDVYPQRKIEIREQKTKKRATLFISDELRRAYRERLWYRDPEEYVFRASDGHGHVSRRTAYRDMQYIAKMAGIPEDINLGTHTLRKTFGYHFYQRTHDIATLMQLFNHSKESTTLIYIGIATDETEEAFRKVSEMYE